MSFNRIVGEHRGKIIIISLLLLFAVLQYFVWLGEHGFARLWQLRQTVEHQVEENQQLKNRNQQLQAEVTDLKKGTDALEERARSELGLIKDKETFYQVLEPDKPKQ